eukprot:scaffold363_cov56-Cylindrotheca_fusiformis.AAC.4
MHATPQQTPQQLHRLRQSRDFELLPSPPKKKARFLLFDDGANANIYLPDLPEGAPWDSGPLPVTLKMRPGRLRPMKKSATSASFLATEPIPTASQYTHDVQ